MTIVDPKGLDFSKYSGASLLTPNKKEAALASGIEINDQPNLEKAADKIFKNVDIGKLLITCGKDGMVLFERNTEPRSASGLKHGRFLTFRAPAIRSSQS